MTIINNNKLKVIIFDFDGTLIDSNNIKANAFVELYSHYGKEISRKVLNYHNKNLGKSRNSKFEMFERTFLNKPFNNKIGNDLSNKFSNLILDKLLDAPLINGTEKFLEKYSKDLKLFIASATPENEVKLIVKRKKLDHYFQGVFGSPKKKGDIVEKILKIYKFKSCEFLLVGDAMSDLNAAKSNLINFIGIKNMHSNIFPKNTILVDDINELRAHIEKKYNL